MDTIDTADSTVTLRPGRAKWSLFALMFGALTAGCVAIAATTSDPGMRWLMGMFALFMAAGAVLSLKSLRPDGAYLRLTQDGFAIKAVLGKERTFLWREVTAFEVDQVKGNTWVVFSLTPAATAERRPGVVRRLSKGVMGFDENLPDTYGMGGPRLAALMNDWRERYAGASLGR